MKAVLLLCLFFVSVLAYPQFSDNFSDGDYTVNPSWSGDTSRFDISLQQALWLNALPVTGAAGIATVSHAIENASWEFRVRLEFNPSSTNHARTYLVADQPVFSGPVAGYYVQVGSTADDISLFRQDGLITECIIDGADGLLNTASCNVGIRVTRDAAGHWELAADTSASQTGYVSLGTALDATYIQCFFTGVYCTYTATRCDKFFFDDFVITGNAIADSILPKVTGVAILGADTLRVTFSEPVDPGTAGTSGFSVDQGIGNPVSAMADPLENSAIMLVYPSTFSDTVLYRLTASGIADFAGNVMADTMIVFSGFTAARNDVVINEILADASPSYGLPEHEFIELYNTTHFPLSLEGWKLVAGLTVKTLPEIILEPDSFIVLASADADFSGISVAGIASFPALTNAGMPLQITDPAGTVIDSVFYSIGWYPEGPADDGGISLEKIHSHEHCAGASNWSSSLDISGGTPGRRNSIHDTSAFLLALSDVQVLDSLRVMVVFNKRLQELSAGHFLIGPDIGAPSSVVYHGPDSILLLLAEPLLKNQQYLLSVTSPVEDCAGHTIDHLLTAAIMHYIPQLYDVVLNEIMADESPAVLLPPAEYVELYNRMDFPVSVKGWKLHAGSSVYELPDIIIPADSYAVIINSLWIQEFQSVCTVPLDAGPALANSGTTLSLYHASGILMHSVSYRPDWYGAAAKENGGWSLEQIDPSKACLGKQNWTASADASGGTPGRKNACDTIIADTIRPYFLRSGLIAPDTGILYLSEAIWPQSITGSMIRVGTEMQSPVFMKIEEPAMDRLIFGLPFAVQDQERVPVYLLAGICDCSGNGMREDTAWLAVPEPAESQDIVINEVLFNPRETGIDYVEVYNGSEKVLDLSQLYIGEGDTGTTDIVMNPFILSLNPALLFPGEYLLLSADGALVRSQYATAEPKAFWDVEAMPGYANSSGVISISNISQQPLDMFAYNEKMHFSLLTSADGVALEKIRPDLPAKMASNWHSAASTCGFGTPGYRNSQFLGHGFAEEAIILLPEIFSPDNDGYADVLQINYAFGIPGYVASIQVLDDSGRLVKDLVKNELLADKGCFYWDGIGDNGFKAQTGIHVINFQVFDLQGNIIDLNRVCVVATRL